MVATNDLYKALDLEERLLRAEDVSDLLNISLPFAYKLMELGRIRTVKVGRSIRVRPIDLSTYIQQNLQNPVDDE
jgi:excisionase family DNA binding protein